MRLFQITDYKIKSKQIYLNTLYINVVLAIAVLLTEIFFDLKAGDVELYAAYTILSIVITVLGYGFPTSIWIKSLLPLSVLMLCEIVFLTNPEAFVFMIYWPLICILALVIQGLRMFYIWSVLILGVHTFNYFYVKDLLGEFYVLEVSNTPTFFGNMVFIISMLCNISFLYTLLGNAYKMSKEKNRELTFFQYQVEEINRKLVTTNESLTKVIKLRNEEIALQNTRLKEYAFANSHLLRSPVSKIIGLADVITSERQIGLSMELMNALKESTEELDSIVKKINNDLEVKDS